MRCSDVGRRLIVDYTCTLGGDLSLRGGSIQFFSDDIKNTPHIFFFFFLFVSVFVFVVMFNRTP